MPDGAIGIGQRALTPQLIKAARVAKLFGKLVLIIVGSPRTMLMNQCPVKGFGTSVLIQIFRPGQAVKKDAGQCPYEPVWMGRATRDINHRGGNFGSFQDLFNAEALGGVRAGSGDSAESSAGA